MDSWRPLRVANSNTNIAITSLTYSESAPLDLVKLKPLMDITSGRPDITVGLIDGPVSLNHPDFETESICEAPGEFSGTCSIASSNACMHGTFVAGILCAKRESQAPAICPNCTLLVRPIFKETTSKNCEMPSAAPKELAEAIVETTNAGANVINLSVGLSKPSSKGKTELEESIAYAARQGVILVAAAGNQGTIGSSTITCHPWVIPVAACDFQGRPISQSNLGSSIGKRGLRAPGENITSLGATGKTLRLSGTSVAAPFVTGTIALLWSQFKKADAISIKSAVLNVTGSGRLSVVPPLLNASIAYQVMRTLQH